MNLESIYNITSQVRNLHIPGRLTAIWTNGNFRLVSLITPKYLLAAGAVVVITILAGKCLISLKRYIDEYRARSEYPVEKINQDIQAILKEQNIGPCLSYYKPTGLLLKNLNFLRGDPNLFLDIFQLNLNEADLNDHDLKRIADSGMFNKVSKLYLNDNPKVTGKGISASIVFWMHCIN